MAAAAVLRSIKCHCGQSHAVDLEAWERVVLLSCACGCRWGALRGTLYEVNPRFSASARTTAPGMAAAAASH